MKCKFELVCGHIYTMLPSYSKNSPDEIQEILMSKENMIVTLFCVHSTLAVDVFFLLRDCAHTNYVTRGGMYAEGAF